MNTNSIKKINKLDQKYEFFWKNYIKENSNKMTLSRNSQWQNWRLQNLIKAKKAFILVFERNKKIVGYSCSTIIKKGPYKVAKLIDIITLDKSEDIFITNITKEVHTPFYCYSAKGLKTNFNILKDAFKDIDTKICYATKSNSNLSILNLLQEEGAVADVVSLRECKQS